MKRFLQAVLPCLLLTASALAQTRPILERRGEVAFGDERERVVAHRPVGADRLVLVGLKSVRVLDAGAAKYVSERVVAVPKLRYDNKWEISPDGRRMLVYKAYAFRLFGHSPASVWDLEKGGRVAELKTSKAVRSGLWSEDGRILATSSSDAAPEIRYESATEVNFWDGETFARKGSLPTDKVGWWYLTADGRKCFFTVGERVNAIIFKYTSGSEGPFTVWDIESGKAEQTIPASGGGDADRIRAAFVSPGEKYLALVAQPPKSEDVDRRLVVFEIEKGGGPRYELRQKYELRPGPLAEPYGAPFSPGAKLLAVGAGRRLHIYGAAGGEQRLDLPNAEAPTDWLAEDVYIVKTTRKLNAFDAATGKHLYGKDLIYVVSSQTTSQEIDGQRYDTTTETIEDETRIKAHPSHPVFVSYSKQFVQVFDTRTGELLQELVAPPTDPVKKKSTSDKPLVSEAGWSGDGRTLYVIDARGRTVTLWSLLDS
ncbi:MAG TPA: hypothetical protein VGX48_20250 [Pyrinomonadaceae bacterium]|nr:hypothetical protein [Pyrinomonadaceae bacterium]